MCDPLISRSSDLTRLMDEGYEVEIVQGSYLIIRNVPYVKKESDGKLEVKRGVLISSLSLSGEVIDIPDVHWVFFSGDYPCNDHGDPITNVNVIEEQLKDGIVEADYKLSKKIRGENYSNYYDKMIAYITALSGYAGELDSKADAKTFPVVETKSHNSVFKYRDSASSRAGIYALSQKLGLGKVAIVGLGGTGSYILDLIAKTPVKQIHLFDGDDFLQHNAFRTPGAASIKHLRKKLKKVEYLRDCYSHMRYYIIPYATHVTELNVQHLDEMDFVFICVDSYNASLPIVKYLRMQNIPFIDVGMSLDLEDGRISGLIRATTSVPGRNLPSRLQPSGKDEGGDGDGNIYDSNIQTADLNALNAALAVIKWKKFCGFYTDTKGELHTVYTVDSNMLNRTDVDSACIN